MLTALGLRRAMAIYGSMDAILLAIAMLLVKERRASSANNESRKIVWIDRTFLRDPVFWSLGICLLLSILYVSSKMFSFTKNIHLISYSVVTSLPYSTCQVLRRLKFPAFLNL